MLLDHVGERVFIKMMISAEKYAEFDFFGWPNELSDSDDEEYYAHVNKVFEPTTNAKFEGRHTRVTPATPKKMGHSKVCLPFPLHQSMLLSLTGFECWETLLYENPLVQQALARA